MNSLWYGNTFKIGVLGGGQLGRMLIQEAINYDVHICCMDSGQDAPCAKLASEYVNGDIQNYDDVMRFGENKDVITVEIEHVNVQALKELEKKGKKVYPQPHILEMIQDKGKQKEFYTKNNIPTAPYALINQSSDIKEHYSLLPVMQKLRTGGYDGKGVTPIKTEKDIQSGFNAPSVLESFVDFEKELSVIVARNEAGESKTFPAVECEFSPSLNLVEFLFTPANIQKEIELEARKIAVNIINKLEMVGILAVEFFLTKEGKLLVNEIAPRPHNSGHHTIECNYTSQFEQHLRAILNLPLGNTEILVPGVMINILGSQGYEGDTRYEGMEKIMAWKGVFPHMYGKAQTKSNRKMGHITIVDSKLENAIEKARKVKENFRIIA